LVDARHVLAIAQRAIAAGAGQVIFADTIGAGVPVQVTQYCERFRAATPDTPFGFHFHNTRNTGYANAIAAVAGGASVLDASVGGIGGCPFAPNATGNIATEDLHYLLRQSGIATGLNEAALTATVDWLARLIPSDITGQLSRAGYFPDISARPTRKDIPA